MIRAGNISVPLDFDFSRLREFCAEKFGISLGEIKSAVLTKKSVDARKKSDVHFVITIDMDVRGEEKLLRKHKNFSAVRKNPYDIPKIGAVSKDLSLSDSGRQECLRRLFLQWQEPAL